ncbi:MAG: cupin domain-containing protein [Bacteroidota bacterium]
MKIICAPILLVMSFVSEAQLPEIAPGVYHWKDLPVRTSEGREGRRIFEGTSAQFDYFEIHATTQMKGTAPRPAHANKDIEELLIVKEGKLKMTINGKSEVLGPGSAIIIMPQDMQQAENAGDGPLTYYVMMYRFKKSMDLERGKSSGGSIMTNPEGLKFKPNERGGVTSYVERPTAMCENLEFHVTTLDKKGPSHNPHTHIDTEIILMIEGDTEMNIDQKMYKGTAGDLYFINSELFHGISNASETVPCRYFAIRWR